MAEQLGVIGRGDNAAVAVLPTVVREQRGNETSEVVRVQAHMAERRLRVPEPLVAEVDARAGDAPVVQAGDIVPLVELSIARLAGVAVLGGPDLHTRAVVAADRR